MGKKKKAVKKLQKKTIKAEPKVEAPVIVAAPPAPPPPVDPSIEVWVRQMYKDLEQHWIEQADHYGYDMDRPDHVTLKMQAVLGASDVAEAEHRTRRAKSTMQTSILAAWAKGKIPGPASELNLERQIKKAESLVAMLEAKGQLDAARGQSNRADSLRESLAILKKENEAAPLT